MEKPGGKKESWFGERRAVRLMLLAALLALGVIHFQGLCRGVAFLWQIAQPLALGAAMAYVLEIVVKYLDGLLFARTKRPFWQRVRRPACILLAAALVFSFLALVIWMVIPGLGDAFAVVARELPFYIDEMKRWALERSGEFPALAEEIEKFQFDWESIQARIAAYAMSGLGGILSSTVSVIGAVTGSVASFFMSLIFAVFLLAGKARLKAQYARVTAAALKAGWLARVNHVLAAAHRAFSGFIIGQTLDAVILGVLTALGMLIFRMPYAVIVGALSGATALVPIIGGYVGAITGAFLVFTVSPVQAFWFLVFIVILQQIAGNVIYPRLVGSSIGLPGLWVIVAVVIGGGLGGVGGMLLGVPLMATAYQLAREAVDKREQRARDEAEK